MTVPPPEPLPPHPVVVASPSAAADAPAAFRSVRLSRFLLVPIAGPARYFRRRA
ncbi:hypothetical protein ACFW1F_04860 [Streptomyces bungoensis]|uniref:hypothetical protein n=1 Tax=Streptomyces bungoensis TaxID=285568 RepID=UPI0036C344BB